MERAKTEDGYQRVRDYLRHAIGEGAFGPGVRLPTERQLAGQFGVGRSVTRRALAELEAEGLIRRQVGRGTFVTPARNAVAAAKIAPGVVSPAEYVEARLRFEPELAWMIVTHATAEDFDRMEECLRRAERASGREEFELWDAAFHQALAAATHNTLAISMYESIHAVRHEQSMWGTLRRRAETPEHPSAYQREHVDILEALRRRDAEASRELLLLHIRNTRRRLLDY
jgi:DNA-binding FadR family transcriptional regulator